MSSHVALFAALLLAGTGTAGCTPEPTASAAEPQAAVQQTPVQQAAGEHTVFSCQLSGGKIVTVKQDGGRLLYRYGTPGEAELEIEGTPTNGRIFQHASVHGGAYDVELLFVSGAYSYIVHSFPRSDIVDNDPTSGLMVFRSGEKIMDRDCAPWAAISFLGDVVYEPELPDLPEGAPSRWRE